MTEHRRLLSAVLEPRLPADGSGDAASRSFQLRLSAALLVHTSPPVTVMPGSRKPQAITLTVIIHFSVPFQYWDLDLGDHGRCRFFLRPPPTL